MNTKAGDRFACAVMDETSIIKSLKMPSEEEFKESLREAQNWVSSVNLTKEDIIKAIKEVRKEKKHNVES